MSQQTTINLGRQLDEADERREDLRRKMIGHVAAGVPGAWDALVAIFGDPTAPKAGAR